ncbi:hypothetical protein V5O48_002757 [Marasmius crinis-equi]|uniref:GH16 domain-containing protein n=1 Tax=Marasmius crinis-equi TaxID=585013 RepID=A0ABR3FUS6_9AGAR
MLFRWLAPLLVLCARVWSFKYVLTESYEGHNFLSGFNFTAIEDPTHGRVNYVNESIASSQNLTYSSDDTFILRSDFTTVLNATGPGRNSVRLTSKRQYNASVMIYNVRHMPEGCGTWPAIWSYGDDWPNNGEIDVVEGTNNQDANEATLHTNTGTLHYGSEPYYDWEDCDWLVNYNAGCGVKFRQAKSFGPAFNANGGGWYAVERNDKFIKVWFWARDNGDVPKEVECGAPILKPRTWGTPDAYFPSTNSCSLEQKFGPHNVIINLTFCGDRAGESTLYRNSGCPSTCVDYVDNNPGAFVEAFFDFAWMKVYETPLIDVEVNAELSA